MTRLVAGPATAMRNSPFALVGSFVSDATPPSRKSVIDDTGKRNRRATIACANSCATTEAKKRSAVTAPAMNAFASDVGKTDGNCSCARP